jgi:transcriptional regulator with XRE-family HTH domain
MNSIGKRIKQIRLDNKLNQVEFSRIIGIAQGALSDIENEKSKPAVDTVISLCRYFNISTDTILLGIENVSLTEEERHLIEVYRQLTEKNKAKVEAYAEVRLEEQERTTPKLSTSGNTRAEEKKNSNSQAV